MHARHSENVFICDSDIKNYRIGRILKGSNSLPDVLLKRYLFLIGGYSEMLFSDAREWPCAYVKEKRTKNAVHIFNMVDISVNPIREKNF